MQKQIKDVLITVLRAISRLHLDSSKHAVFEGFINPNLAKNPKNPKILVLFRVMCHVSCVIFICHVSCVMCHVSWFMCHVSFVISHVSCVNYQVSCVMCHVESVMCHVSFVMCHVSCIMCHVS